MKIIKDGTITNVKGIKAAGISAQLKKSGKKDLALIYSEKKAVSAAVFTKKSCKSGSDYFKYGKYKKWKYTGDYCK